MTEPNDNPAVYVWALMITAVITLWGLYALNRSQLHQPTQAQIEECVKASHSGAVPEDTQQYTMRQVRESGKVLRGK